MDILRYYANEGNRELYWNYLAQKPGNDGYGLLALGVVRNDNMPGALANQYAQNQAQSVNGVRLSERQWDRFGQDLMQRDFTERQKTLRGRKACPSLELARTGRTESTRWRFPRGPDHPGRLDPAPLARSRPPTRG